MTSYGTDQIDPWLHVHFRANLFSFEEWPEVEPASFEDLSIGEEQSESYVVSLAWSPPGLAKHGKCALAVLTSNSLLCIWDPQSDPANPAAWCRASVVNDILAHYYDNSMRARRSNTYSESMLRKGKRIRGFAWAPALPPPPSSEVRHSDICILAIVNDSSGLFLLRVRTTRDIEAMTCDASTKCPVIPLNTPSSENPDGLLPEVYWTSWRVDDLLAHNTLQLRVNGSLISMIVNAQWQAQLELNLTVQISDQYPVPLATTRRLPWGCDTTHTVFGPEAHLNQLVENHRQRFSAEHNLGDKVMAKTWGNSEYEGYLVRCISLHPTEMIEYIIRSHERCHLEFTHRSFIPSPFADQPSLSFPWEVAPVTKSPSEAHATSWKALVEYVPIPSVQRGAVNLLIDIRAYYMQVLKLESSFSSIGRVIRSQVHILVFLRDILMEGHFQPHDAHTTNVGF